MNDHDELETSVRSALRTRFPLTPLGADPDLTFMSTTPSHRRRIAAAAGACVSVLAIALAAIAITADRRGDGQRVAPAASPPVAVATSSVADSTEPPTWAMRCMPAGGQPVPRLIGLELSRARIAARSLGIGIESVSKNGKCSGLDRLNLYNHPVAVAIDATGHVLTAVEFPRKAR